MINFSDVMKKFEEYSLASNQSRNKDKHLSEVAICGYKYRDRIDSGKQIPFNLNYNIGNAFENIIIYQLKKLANINSQYVTHYDDFIGHLDAYDVDEKIVYELKTTMSYYDGTDIYLRQLKAYMIATNAHRGVLWIYKTLKKEQVEIIIDEIKDEDILNLHKNIKAFRENTYIDGIENSLCKFCDNFVCPTNKSKSKSIEELK